MKQIILHPLIFSLLLLVGLIYFVIVFQLISGNSKRSKTVEIIFIVLSTLILGGMTIGFSARFHPRALYEQDVTFYHRLMPLMLYVPFFILLSSRLLHTLQDYVYVVSVILKKSPFFCIFMAWRLISSFFSETPVYSVKATLILLLLTACLIYVGKEYDMKYIFTILIWHYSVVLLVSLFHGTENSDYWHGVYLSKNSYGFALALTTILLYLQSVCVPKSRWLFLGLVALAVFCLRQANSGMAKVLLIILISLLVFLRFIRRLPPRVAFASMGVFLAIGISLVILITENAEYIIVEKLGKDMTLTGRTYIWYRVENAINKRPWFGYGYEGFWQPWREQDNPAGSIILSEANGFRPQHSHNGYLEIALQAGWVGLAVFIASLLMGIYYGVLYLTRSSKPEAVLPLVIFTWIVIGSITENPISNITMYWIVYVLMITRLSLDTAQRVSSNTQLAKSVTLESK